MGQDDTFLKDRHVYLSLLNFTLAPVSRLDLTFCDNHVYLSLLNSALTLEFNKR